MDKSVFPKVQCVKSKKCKSKSCRHKKPHALSDSCYAIVCGMENMVLVKRKGKEFWTFKKGAVVEIGARCEKVYE